MEGLTEIINQLVEKRDTMTGEMDKLGDKIRETQMTLDEKQEQYRILAHQHDAVCSAIGALLRANPLP